MNLGKMLRSGRAVDIYATDSAEAVALAVEPVVAAKVEPVIVEKIVYVDKVIEKPVYIDRVVEVEKIVEVPAAAATESAFFEDFVPSNWTKQETPSNA